MKCYCIATLRESNETIYGFRIADIDSMAKQPDGKVAMKTIDVPYSTIGKQLKADSNAIRNLKIEGNSIIGAEGSLNRYPMVYRNGKVVESVVIIRESNDNIICCNSTGHCTMYPEKKIVELSKHIQIANGKIVNGRLAELVANTFKVTQLEKPKENKKVEDNAPKQNISKQEALEAQSLMQKVNQLRNTQQAQAQSKYTWLSKNVYGNKDVEMEINSEDDRGNKLVYIHKITLYNNVDELVLPSFITAIKEIEYDTKSQDIHINKLSLKHNVIMYSSAFSKIAPLSTQEYHLINELNIELPKDNMINKTSERLKLGKFSVKRLTTNSLYQLYNCVIGTLDISKSKAYKIEQWLIAVKIGRLIMPNKAVILGKEWIIQGYIQTLVLNGATALDDIGDNNKVESCAWMPKGVYSIDPYIQSIENSQYIKRVYEGGLTPYVGERLDLGDVEVEGQMMFGYAESQGQATRLLREVHINSIKQETTRQRKRYKPAGKLKFKRNLKENEVFNIYFGRGEFELIPRDIDDENTYGTTKYNVYYNSPAHKKLREIGVKTEDIIIIDAENIPDEVKALDAKNRVFNISQVDNFLTLVKDYVPKAKEFKAQRKKYINDATCIEEYEKHPTNINNIKSKSGNTQLNKPKEYLDTVDDLEDLFAYSGNVIPVDNTKGNPMPVTESKDTCKIETVISKEALKEIEANKQTWESFEINNGKGYEIADNYKNNIIPCRDETQHRIKVSTQQINYIVNTLRNTLQSCTELFSPTSLPKVLNATYFKLGPDKFHNYPVEIYSKCFDEIICGKTSIYRASIKALSSNELAFIIIVRVGNRVEEAFICEESQRLGFNFNTAVEQESLEDTIINSGFTCVKSVKRMNTLAVGTETDNIDNYADDILELYYELPYTSYLMLAYETQARVYYMKTKNNKEFALNYYEDDYDDIVKSVNAKGALEEFKQLSANSYATIIQNIKQYNSYSPIKDATPSKLWINAKKYQNELLEIELPSRYTNNNGKDKMCITKEGNWYQIASDLMNNEYYIEKDIAFYESIVNDKEHKGFDLDDSTAELRFPDGTVLRELETSKRGFKADGVIQDIVTAGSLKRLVILDNNIKGASPRYFIGGERIADVFLAMVRLARLLQESDTKVNLEEALAKNHYTTLHCSVDNIRYTCQEYYLFAINPTGFYCSWRKTPTWRKTETDVTVRNAIIMDYNTGISYLAIILHFGHKYSHSRIVNITVPLLRLESLYSGFKIMAKETPKYVKKFYEGIAIGITEMLKENIGAQTVSIEESYERCRLIGSGLWDSEASAIMDIMRTQDNKESLIAKLKEINLRDSDTCKFILNYYGYLEK